jgi:hypothetical protein
LEIDRLLRLRAPTNEIVHRVAPKKRPQSFKYFAIKPTNSPRNVAPSQNHKRVAPQRSAAFSRPRWGIGLDYLPSNPITHRPQARAVSVPQDA